MTREELRNIAAVAVLQAIVTRPHNLTTYPGAAEQFTHDAEQLADTLVARLMPEASAHAEPRNCGTCWHHEAHARCCHKRNLAVQPDMSCPDWSPIS